RKARDLSILDRDIETIDRRLVGTHRAGVLDHKVVELFHSRVFSLPTLPPCADLSASDLAVANRTHHRVCDVTGACLSSCPQVWPEPRIVCRAGASPASRSVH